MMQHTRMPSLSTHTALLLCCWAAPKHNQVHTQSTKATRQSMKHSKPDPPPSFSHMHTHNRVATNTPTPPQRQSQERLRKTQNHT